jgi:hypothetical protein
MAEKTESKVRWKWWSYSWTWWRIPMLVLGVVVLLGNTIHLMPEISGDLSVIRYNRHKSEEERVALVHPLMVSYSQFVKANLSPGDVIGSPKPDQVPWYLSRLSQYDILGYFMYPHQVTRIWDPSYMEKVDAFLATEEYPPNYPRDHYIPYPAPTEPSRVVVYLDALKLTGKNGEKMLFEDFEAGSQAGLDAAQRLAQQRAGPETPPTRFQFLRSYDGRFRSFAHQNTSEKAWSGRRAEKFEFELMPWKDVFFGIPVEPFPLEMVKSMSIRIWTDRKNVARLGLLLEDDRQIRSVRNRLVYRWDKIEIEDMEKTIREYGFENVEGIRVKGITLTFMDFNYLIFTGVIPKEK